MKSLLCIIYLLFCLATMSYGAPAVFGTASVTQGARRGLGLGGGLGLVECSGDNCSALALLYGRRYSQPGVDYFELGFGKIFYYFPVYGGVGIRRTNRERTGHQISLGGGLGPVLLVTRFYSEREKRSAEVSLDVAFPIYC